jgi:hypothetical protein
MERKREKIATFTPMPSASMLMARAAKPGARRSERKAAASSAGREDMAGGDGPKVAKPRRPIHQSEVRVMVMGRGDPGSCRESFSSSFSFSADSDRENE